MEDSEAVDRAQKREDGLVARNDAFDIEAVVVVGTLFRSERSEMTDLRSAHEGGRSHLKVAKNRLAKLALKDTNAEHIKRSVQGPTVIAYSDDPVSAPKVAAEFRQGQRASL